MDREIRIHKRRALPGAAIIANSLSQDKRLSWAARGLQVYLLSLPEHWIIREAHLIEQSPKGRDHLRAIVQELMAMGYIVKRQPRMEDGRMGPAQWEVWDSPRPMPHGEKPSAPQPGNPSTDGTEGGSSGAGFSVSGESGPLEKKQKPEREHNPERNPLAPQSGERPSRDDGTNPRALGTNPRATGQNPRALGTNPRADSLAKQPESGAQSQSTTHAATMTATAGTAPAQAPPRAKGRQASTDPLARKELPAAAVPEDLAHLAALLADWWAVKGKGRTTRAFELACRHLRRYGQADQEAILETAIMSGHQGLYPPKGSTNGRGSAPQQHPFLPPLYGARPTRGEVAAANVLQMMAESDRKKAEFRARMEAGMASANVPEDQR